VKQKIGTVCDDYKVAMFKEEFEKANIEIISIKPFTKGTTIFTCFSEQSLVKPIADKVTQYFIDKYKKGN
jgi:hypothetical protein